MAFLGRFLINLRTQIFQPKFNLAGIPFQAIEPYLVPQQSIVFGGNKAITDVISIASELL